MRLLTLGILIGFLGVAQVTAQDFGSLGSEWFYASKKGDATGPPKSEYTYMKSTKDTTILGKLTHKITVTDINRNDTIQHEPVYLYQEQDTLFMYSEVRSGFITYFVFNRQKGDSLTLGVPDRLLNKQADSTYQVFIDTIYKDTVDGVPLNHYQTLTYDRDSFYYVLGDVIAGIGPTSYFFPRLQPSTPGGPGPLRCYRDDSIEASFADVDCRYLRSSGNAEPEGNRATTIYPNPAYEQVRIDTRKTIAQIQVFNLIGKQISTKYSEPVNLKHLDAGTYVLRILFKDGKELHKQIMKKGGH